MGCAAVTGIYVDKEGDRNTSTNDYIDNSSSAYTLHIQTEVSVLDDGMLIMCVAQANREEVGSALNERVGE